MATVNGETEVNMSTEGNTKKSVINNDISSQSGTKSKEMNPAGKDDEENDTSYRRNRSISRKKNKRKRSSSTSSSSSSYYESSSSSYSSSSSRERKRRRKKKKKKKKEKTKKENKEEESTFWSVSPTLNTWNLDENLARYVEQNIRKYIPDKDLQRDILDTNPVPSNVTNPFKLDPTMENFLRGKHTPGKQAITKDKSLTRISGKIRDTLGPLSKLWQEIETSRKGKSDKQLDSEMVAKLLQQTVTLIGQAINATTFYRRRSVLTTLGLSEGDSNSMLRDTYMEELLESGDNLFGDQFMKSIHKQARALGKTSKQLLMPYPEAFKRDYNKPFSGRSSSFDKRHGGERKGSHDSNRSQRGKNKQKHKNSCVQSNKISVDNTNSQRKIIFSWENTPRSEIPVERIKNDSKLPGRENKIILSKLGKTYKGPEYIKYGQGIGNSSNNNSKTGKNPKTNFIWTSNETTGANRNFSFTGQRSYCQSYSNTKPTVISLISKGKERTREVQASNKLEGIELSHTLLEIQNGDFERGEKHSTSKRLHGKNRPEGCLFFNPIRSEIKKVCEISMGRNPVRISMPDVWAGSSTEVLHKNNEDTDFTVKETKNKSLDIHRRHSDSSIDERESNICKGYNNISLTKPRISDKFREISAEPIPNNGISGDTHRQQNYDFLHPTEKITTIREDMQRYIRDGKDNIKEASKCHREPYGNRPSIHSCSFTGEIHAEMLDSEFENIETELRDLDNLRTPGQRGTKMVGGEYQNEKWETNKNPTTRSDNKLRCSGRTPGGLGSTLWRGIYGGSMDSPRKNSTYKHPRAESSSISNQNVYKKSQGSIYSPIDRQSSSLSPSYENGKTDKQELTRLDQKDLVLSNTKEHFSNCGIHPVNSQQKSGFPISELNRLGRLETRPQDIQENHKTVGIPNDRFVCLKDITSNPQLFQLETGPILSRSGCINSRMESRTSLCIPPILSDRKVSRENTEDQNCCSDSDSPNLGDSTLVSNAACNANRPPKDNSNTGGYFKTSIRRTAQFVAKQHTKTSSLEDFRVEASTDGLSETASNLIQDSRSVGTRKHYKSAWTNFESWCSERKTDPFSAPLDYILNYLSDLFDKGYEYNTINGHRSAISSQHQQIDGHLVGQHPKIKSLMKGVARQKPPKPKYTNIWDVDQVLKKFKEMGDNNTLTLKDLSIKTITLLGLVQPNRGSELTDLDLKFMGKTETTLLFHLHNPTKTFKQGKNNNKIEIRKFEEEKKLCPYDTICTYIEKTNEQRQKQKTSKLFLSYVNPHKPVGKDTTARWVREMLSRSGINPNIFKPHSKRSASTSKAFSKGASLNEVLKMGNWSNESVWQRFYHREFSTAEKYQKLILKDKALNKDLAYATQP